MTNIVKCPNCGENLIINAKLNVNVEVQKLEEDTKKNKKKED